MIELPHVKARNGKGPPESRNQDPSQHILSPAGTGGSPPCRTLVNTAPLQKAVEPQRRAIQHSNVLSARSHFKRSLFSPQLQPGVNRAEPQLIHVRSERKTKRRKTKEEGGNTGKRAEA